MTDHTPTLSSLITALEQNFEDVPPGVLQPETVLYDYIQYNSVNALVMTILLESDFGVSATYKDLTDLKTVHDLHALILTRTGA